MTMTSQDAEPIDVQKSGGGKSDKKKKKSRN
jgi:hypothetical protein